MSPTRRSTTQPSNEATAEQLRLARREGDAFGAAVEHMTHEEAHGAEQAAGDYLVGYAVEEAEGMYRFADDALSWHEPAEDENLHVEVVVRDRDDGRFIPALTVRATLIAEDGTEVGTHEQPFLWHPWLFHYGRNWTVPGDGTYRLRVAIDPPAFMRHDRENGERYTERVEVEFDAVQVETGRKTSASG